MATLEDFAKVLQRDLALSDLLTTPASGDPNIAHFSVLVLGRLKIKMYQEKGHAMPHLHVDYGPKNHAASFAIDPPSLLEGSLGRENNATVMEFIVDHRNALLSMWLALQSGAGVTDLMAELKGDCD